MEVSNNNRKIRCYTGVVEVIATLNGVFDNIKILDKRANKDNITTTWGNFQQLLNVDETPVFASPLEATCAHNQDIMDYARHDSVRIEERGIMLSKIIGVEHIMRSTAETEALAWAETLDATQLKHVNWIKNNCIKDLTR